MIGQSVWQTWVMSKGGWGLYNHDLDKLPAVAEWALRHCLDRGIVVLADRGSEHQVLLRKYIHRTGGRGLVLGVPDSRWSKRYMPELCDELTARNIAFRKANEAYGETNVGLHVDCSQDTKAAAELIRYCFLDLFRLGPAVRIKSSPSEYSIIYDDVHDPDYRNPTGAEFWPALRKQQQAKGYPDPNLNMQGAAFTVGGICCFPALWAAWFFAQEAPPSWTLAVGPVDMAGSFATLVLLPVFCALLVGWRRSAKKLARDSEMRQRTVIDRLAGPLFVYALPLVVVASWIGL